MPGRRADWRGTVLALVVATGAVVSARAEAHPLGNFSINHYTALRLGQDAVDVRYVVDMAEVPTFQEIQESGIHPEIGDPALSSYLARQATALKERLSLAIDGHPVPLEIVSTDAIFPPGAGGLPTMKIGILYRARLAGSSGPLALAFEDNTFPGRAGWKEVIAVANPGVSIASATVPSTDRSRELSDYPTDLLNSPPQDLAARVVFSRALASAPPAGVGDASSATPAVTRPTVASPTSRPAPALIASPVSKPTSPVALLPPPEEPGPTRVQAPPSPPLTPNRQSRSNTFTELIENRQRGLGIAVLALLVAIGLGAFHALEPGHGKTVVAAYLVGSRGTARHAVILGSIVTASHTAGVYLLGLVTLYASRYVLPERLYPWLGVLSGATIAGLGLILLWRRVAGAGHDHSHSHDHHHGHTHDGGACGHGHAHADSDLHAHAHDHGHTHVGVHTLHEHEGGVDADGPGRSLDSQHELDLDAHRDGSGHGHSDAPTGERVSLRELFALGITGGIVPCPAALVVLLSALSLGRVGFGLLLIAAFSIGLAAVLVAIGLLMVYARRFMSRVRGDGPIVTRWLPLTSAAVMTVLGLAIAMQALVTAVKL